MKAQMAKNAVIVPVGSKVVSLLNLNKGFLSSGLYGKSCYMLSKFLRGLLDLTDNLVNGEIVWPAKKP